MRWLLQVGRITRTHMIWEFNTVFVNDTFIWVGWRCKTLPPKNCPIKSQYYSLLCRSVQLMQTSSNAFRSHSTQGFVVLYYLMWVRIADSFPEVALETLSCHVIVPGWIARPSCKNQCMLLLILHQFSTRINCILHSPTCILSKCEESVLKQHSIRLLGSFYPHATESVSPAHFPLALTCTSSLPIAFPLQSSLLPLQEAASHTKAEPL